MNYSWKVHKILTGAYTYHAQLDYSFPNKAYNQLIQYSYEYLSKSHPCINYGKYDRP